MMKYCLAWLFSFTLLLTAAPVNASRFIEGLEDVPLMDGLKQLPNDTLSFGNEEGRLVELGSLHSESSGGGESFY